MPPLAIIDPLIRTNFSAQPITARILYNDAADSSQLVVRLNEVEQDLAGATIGANEAIVTLGSSGLREGRNVLSAYLPSADPAAADGLDGSAQHIVRHRVFYFRDSDLDGVPDSVDGSAFAGAPDNDIDGDGLVDNVEARPGLAAGKVLGTSFDGTITIDAVEPDRIVAGHAAFLRGSGMEAIDLPAEVVFQRPSDLALFPAPELLYRSPTGLVVAVPPELDGSDFTIVTLTDLDGGSLGTVSASVAMETRPPTDVGENLVLIAGIAFQTFVDPSGQIIDGPQFNIPFFNNLLQFGSETRVLIDATIVNPVSQGFIVPLLPPSLESALDVDQVDVRRSGTFSSSVLADVDLLFLLVADPVRYLSTAEADAIETWLGTPGRRLVVISDSYGSANSVANNLLATIAGADSLFNSFFPSNFQQANGSFLTSAIDPQSEFTAGVPVLYYSFPTSIYVLGDASLIAVAGICLFGETPDVEMTPTGPKLVGCFPPDSTESLPTIDSNYVASESVPVDLPPGDPSLALTDVGGQAFSGGSRLVVLDPPVEEVSIEARFENLTPTLASLQIVEPGGGVTSVALSPVFDPGSTTSGTLMGSVPLAPEQEALGIRVTAGPGEETVSDTAVVRVRREKIHLELVTFRGTPQAGGAVEDAVPAEVRERALRQAGLEFFAMCSVPSGVPLDVAHPGLEPEIEMVLETSVEQQERFELVLLTDEERSVEVERLLLGQTPDGQGQDPEIPQPAGGGVSDVRLFLARKFRREDALVRRDLPQNAETGVSTLGMTYLRTVLDGTTISDTVVMQAPNLDLEAGALRIDRPTVSGVGHELAHVLFGCPRQPRRAGRGSSVRSRRSSGDVVAQPDQLVSLRALHLDRRRRPAAVRFQRSFGGVPRGAPGRVLLARSRGLPVRRRTTYVRLHEVGEMKRRLGVLLSALVAAAPAVAADLESLTDDEIRRVMESGDLEAFEALIGERPPPAPPATEEEFERAFRVKQPERMGWARAALEDPKPGTPFVGAVNGLAREGTPEARALLREFVPRFELLDRRRRWIMKAWAYAFAQEYGEATAREARRGVEDLALPALDRALHLMAFRLVDREEALRFYRPYLRDPEPEVRYAALQVNSKHWDSEVTETLIELEDGTDPLVRETARWLSKRYLRWGDARPEPGGWGTMSPQFRRAHPTPADPEGWKAHGARAAEWRRQQYILVHGEEPPPPPPPPRSPEELRLRVVDPERGSLFEER